MKKIIQLSLLGSMFALANLQAARFYNTDENRGYFVDITQNGTTNSLLLQPDSPADLNTNNATKIVIRYTPRNLSTYTNKNELERYAGKNGELLIKTIEGKPVLVDKKTNKTLTKE